MFGEVSADLQKFHEALRFICAWKPTGVTEADILSMAIAKHMGKRYGMSYEAKSFPHDEWKKNKAWEVHKEHP